jgi:hypothetical protein
MMMMNERPTGPTLPLVTIPPDRTPMTFDELQKYVFEGVYAPGNTATNHIETFEHAVASEAQIKADLSKFKNDKLKRWAGPYSRGKKADLVDDVYRNFLNDFTLSENVQYMPFSGETSADGMRRAVAKATDESLKAHAENHVAAEVEAQARRKAANKATKEPETLEEFEIAIRRRGIKAINDDPNARVPKKQSEVEALIFRTGMKQLSDDELARYDEMMAAKGHERRANQLIEKATVKRIEIGEGNYMEIAKSFHTKRQVDQWIVVLAEREDRTTFEELCIAARKLGGDYQRAWAPANSPGGFAFDNPEAADKFVLLQSKDLFLLERLEKLVANRDRVRGNAVEHFGGLSERMEDRAQEVLTGDRKLNTERRVMQFERAKDNAHEQIAMAGTLRNHADALAKRLALHTDKIRWRTHAEAFDNILRHGNGRMAAVEYPWPVVGAHTLATIADQIKDRDGSKLISQRIIKKIREAHQGEVHFCNGWDADLLRDFYRRARLHRVKGWALDSVRHALGDFKRVRLMGLDTLPELRAALREHLGHKVEVTEMTRAEKVMRDMYPGAFPPDYFPTPRGLPYHSSSPL